MQLKRRSLKKKKKKIRASTGFEPMTSALPVRCSTNFTFCWSDHQREVTFQKGSVNIVLRQKSPSLPKTDDPQPSTSSQIQPPQESAKSNNNESESNKKGNFPKTHQRLKELLLQTKDTRLSEDGKRIECVRCGKSPKLDKCKRTAEGHMKYFQRVHKNTFKSDGRFPPGDFLQAGMAGM